MTGLHMLKDDVTWNAALVTNDGQRAIFKSGFSGNLILVDVKSRSEVARIWTGSKPRSFQRLEIEASPNSRVIATATEEGIVRLWSANDGRRLATLTGHHGARPKLAFSPDSSKIAVAASDGKIRVYPTTFWGQVSLACEAADAILPANEIPGICRMDPPHR